MSKPTVWRVVWDVAGLTMRSDWSVHHDMVRDYADEMAKNMPGTDVRIESATVTDVQVRGTHSLQTEPGDFDAVEDPVSPYDVDPDYERGSLNSETTTRAVECSECGESHDDGACWDGD